MVLPSPSAWPTKLGRGAVGLAWRPELAHELLRAPHCVDFVEIIAENTWTCNQRRREAVALTDLWPVVVHGVKLSLGSVEGLDRQHLQRLADLARDVRAPWVSEHVSFVRSRSGDIGHLTGLPRTKAALAVLLRNIHATQRALGDIPLLLENVAITFTWASDGCSEAEFMHDLVEQSGCGLLVDLENLYANAINRGDDPQRVLSHFPVEAAAMFHLAGGAFEDGFFHDTHAHPISPAVFELLRLAWPRANNCPVVIERDGLFPPFAELLREIAACRACLPPTREQQVSAGQVPLRRRPRPHGALLSAPSIAQLADDLAELTSHLLEPTTEFHEHLTLLASDDVNALLRTRAVLQSKRLDEALPLLVNLGQERLQLEPLAAAFFRHTPRSRALPAVSDALHLATLALERNLASPLAELDVLLLRARFVEDRLGQGLVVRKGPFVARTQHGPRRRWVVKGFGASASVHVLTPASRKR